MRKILLFSLAMLFSASSVFAAKIPDNVQNFINKDFPKTVYRFDGLITLPDNTLYLPLYPAKIKNEPTLLIKTTFPQNMTLKQKPNIVIFNNEFSLLKVLTDEKGKNSIMYLPNPPTELRSGLLPQDMLVPRGLVVPENLKGIIGNLEITTSKDTGLKIPPQILTDTKFNNLSSLPQLANKTIYVATCYNKNIQVVNAESKTPAYALTQSNIPNTIKAYNNKFLLVTSFGKKTLDVISLADDQVIKQIDFKTIPDEIIIDNKAHIAYVSSSEDDSIYLINLDTMTFMKQLKLNGMCEKITLSDDGTKLFYYDKQTGTIWAIELNENYLMKELGKFPNVSKIAYANNKIYITSRTKNRLAIVDYKTINLIAEVDIEEKPVDMLTYKNDVYILGASNNTVQIVNTQTDELTKTIYLNTYGFSTKIYRIEGTNLALVTDTRASMYSILDLDRKEVIKTNAIATPVSSIAVTEKIKKIGK